MVVAAAVKPVVARLVSSLVKRGPQVVFFEEVKVTLLVERAVSSVSTWVSELVLSSLVVTVREVTVSVRDSFVRGSVPGLAVVGETTGT